MGVLKRYGNHPCWASATAAFVDDLCDLYAVFVGVCFVSATDKLVVVGLKWGFVPVDNDLVKERGVVGAGNVGCDGTARSDPGNLHHHSAKD